MIEIFGKPMCPFCEQAKQLCETRGLAYTYKSLGTDYTKEELLENFQALALFHKSVLTEQ